MTKQEFIRQCLEAIEEYRRSAPPKERFAQMVASGIINAKGEVLRTKEERAAGRPLPDTPEDGSPTK
jgi:hypothetical protein